MNNARRSTRHALESVVHVQNTMANQPMGRLGNLSSDGLMLIVDAPIAGSALFQLQFVLPDRHAVPQIIEIGVHEQWSAPGAVRGQYWAGFRIIDIGAREQGVLDDWLARQQGK